MLPEFALLRSWTVFFKVKKERDLKCSVVDVELFQRFVFYEILLYLTLSSIAYDFIFATIAFTLWISILRHGAT